MTINETCTWAINNFPRKLKDRYASYVKANGVTIRNHLEYLVAKELRENGVDVPLFTLKDLLAKISKGKT